METFWVPTFVYGVPTARLEPVQLFHFAVFSRIQQADEDGDD